nr:M4 family metallopeptidase [Nocardioides luti]
MQGLSLALLGAGLAAVPGLQTAAVGETAPTAAPGTAQLRSAADGRVTITKDPATGRIAFVRVSRGGDLLPRLGGSSQAGAIAKADAFVTTNAAALGAGPGELVRSRVTTSPYGRTVVYTQQYHGVPVFGAMVKANLDGQGDLTSVNGYAAPDLDLAVTPAVPASTAASYAVANVKADPPGLRGRTADVSTVRATASKLLVYRTGSTKGVPGKAVLAWQVSVGNGAGVNESVLVDAATGKLVNRYTASEAADFATDRELYEKQSKPANLVWKDGDAFPGSLTTEQQNLMYDAGNTYWLFANTFDYDSFDGAGAKMVTVANLDDPDGTFCPNAQWTGTEINMCPGSEADDIVSHEWGHAYTQYTSGLVYQYQSGALNESYSDVWGETIDLINNREDGGEGNISAARPVGACSTSTRGEVGVKINAPASIAKECDAAAASFGPTIDKTGITGDVVRAKDVAESDGGTTNDGCSPYTNAAAVNGHIALAYERPGCDYGTQARNAQDAGATAIIVGSYDENVIPMSTQEQGITIPAVMIKRSDRATIASKLGSGPVNVTIRDIDPAQRTASTRWLVGEQGKVFGGALRDMWTPTCYGNAGKVSDAEYYCGTGDSGGVHLNSGVPNHAYALLVDGGTYNGVTVPGIGLDKAANLWWLTQLDHLTPTSDFADMADGLDAACATLTGQPIRQLSVKRVTPGAAAAPITTADCAAVKAVAAAVQLRKKPTQCNYKPLLKKGSPSVCGKQFTTKTVFKDGFRHGLQKWTKSKVLSTGKARSFPWKGTKNTPGKHRGRVVMSADPDAGTCARNDNVASSNAITSRAIRLPSGAAPRLSFQHYLATEAGYDGGNVKISVNGGKFKVVPNGAYAFNKPNSALLAADQGNSNPMAGQKAFNGTDGGTATGSWGTSIVNLAKAGAKPGDKVKIRFDMGRDCAAGLDGWYVDNVKVQVCKKKAGATVADRRRTSGRR